MWYRVNRIHSNVTHASNQEAPPVGVGDAPRPGYKSIYIESQDVETTTGPGKPLNPLGNNKLSQIGYNKCRKVRKGYYICIYVSIYLKRRMETVKCTTHNTTGGKQPNGVWGESQQTR